MPSFPVLHCLLEFAQTHAHWVGDTIHPTISSSVTSFSWPQFFPGSGYFPKRWLFASGGQNIGVWALASVLPMSIQDWFPLGLTSLILLQSKGLSRVFSSITIQKHQFFGTPSSLWPNHHKHTWLIEKTIQLLLYGSLSAKWCFCFLICCVGLS